MDQFSLQKECIVFGLVFFFAVTPVGFRSRQRIGLFFLLPTPKIQDAIFHHQDATKHFLVWNKMHNLLDVVGIFTLHRIMDDPNCHEGYTNNNESRILEKVVVGNIPPFSKWT